MQDALSTPSNGNRSVDDSEVYELKLLGCADRQRFDVLDMRFSSAAASRGFETEEISYDHFTNLVDSGFTASDMDMWSGGRAVIGALSSVVNIRNIASATADSKVL